MLYEIGEHARQQMQDRKITEDEIDRVMQNPQQVVDGKKGRKIYQSLIVKDGQMMILRLAVVVKRNPPLVVTVYPTTQGRYWKP
jgi:hypothetical protein